MLQLAHKAINKRWLWENANFRIGYTIAVPDARQYTLRPNYEDAVNGITITAEGLRRVVPESGTGPIVACVGDSVPFGSGVSDSDSYPSQLSLLFAQRPNPVRVLNGAVPSYNTRQSLLNFDIKIARHLSAEERGVVILEAANDVTLLTNFREGWNPNITWAQTRFGHGAHSSLVDRSAVYYFAKKFLISRWMTGIDGVERHSTYPPDRMLASVRENLSAWVRDNASSRRPLVLLPINPFFYSNRPFAESRGLPQWPAGDDAVITAWAEIIERYNTMLADVAKESPTVYFLDTRQYADEHERSQLYLDVLHYSPAGHKLIAERIAEFLERIAFPSEREAA